MKEAKIALIGIIIFVIILGYITQTFLNDIKDHYSKELKNVEENVKNQQADEASSVLDELKKDWNERLHGKLQLFVHHSLIDEIYKELLSLSVMVDQAQFDSVNEKIALIQNGIDRMCNMEVISLGNIF